MNVAWCVLANDGTSCPSTGWCEVCPRWTESSLQSRVGAWHRKRFPEAGMEHVALKATAEMGEVADAVNAIVDVNSGHPERANLPEEAADVTVCLLVLLDRWCPGVDLFAEVEKKLAILTDPNSGHPAAALA